MLRINSNSEDRCINLKRKIILLNSSGKINSSLFSPIDNGYKTYCSTKDRNGISPTCKVIRKIKTITIDPEIPETIFFILKLKIKWIMDKKTIIKKKYPDGVCFDKKDIPRTIGKTNQ